MAQPASDRRRNEWSTSTAIRATTRGRSCRLRRMARRRGGSTRLANKVRDAFRSRHMLG
ncbi:unnamed protein product [Heligmosomoides polygyrus]|uniref:Uncharacterized protein n=1 Tax=Heligmosomoides polygyrus TaxID=6339 RepID=A0A3P7WZ42_HELPZ|nr:unnamed protein product [Heligmosomoides polygyrus]